MVVCVDGEARNIEAEKGVILSAGRFSVARVGETSG